MNKVVLVGAGGKMGCRLTDNLKGSSYEVAYLEVSQAGLGRMAERGVHASQPEDVVPQADLFSRYRM